MRSRIWRGENTKIYLVGAVERQVTVQSVQMPLVIVAQRHSRAIYKQSKTEKKERKKKERKKERKKKKK